MSEAPKVPDIIRSTVDLADQDRATGHLTTFWHQRVLALCELLGGAVAAGAGDPQESKDQQRGDPQEGDLCTAVRRYLSYIADVRSGRVKHLDRGVVLNYAQDMERHL